MHVAAIALLAVSIATVIAAGIAGRWRFYGPNGSVGRAATRVVLVGLGGTTVAIIWLAVLASR